VLGFFTAFVLGAVVGLALVALKLRGRKDAVPFGPFLAAGTVLAGLWGDPILRWYSGGSFCHCCKSPFLPLCLST
jgi:Type II secretory pathway, prepilin signal peptidase PulO and related peptidases